MGYYCTVPQCTSLAGKTKNVKFHRFPRDTNMADKWNIILKRGKPITKYSKVCSLHFTQADYNISTMGQWKTLNKDAVPTQNLPKLNPDGTVMVIRKSRTVKYKEQRKEDIVSDKTDKWMQPGHPGLPLSTTPDRILPPANEPQDSALTYRLQKLNDIANIISPHQTSQSLSPPLTQPSVKPKKQDAIMQTDPVADDEDQYTNYESSEKSYSPDMEQYQSQQEQYKNQEQFKEQEQFEEQEQYKDDYVPKKFELPKDYTKPTDDYLPQTNEEYNKEAEKYALERKSHNGYEKGIEFPKQIPVENGYPKQQEMFQPEYEVRTDGYSFHSGHYGDNDALRGQQHNMMLQDQHRINENQNFCNETHIKVEIDYGNDEEKFLYERNKDQIESIAVYESQRRLMQQLQHTVKQEPDVAAGCENVMQPQTSPYYNTNGHTNVTSGYYEQLSRPGPEMLIAKQNALAAHTQLWQNTMKRPFFYSESSPYNSAQLIQRYEDLTRIQQ